MQRVKRKNGWLTHKYGENISPWECKLMIPNENSSKAKNFTLEYNFEKFNS